MLPLSRIAGTGSKTAFYLGPSHSNPFSCENAYLLMSFRLIVHMKTKTNGEKNASKSRHFHTKTDKCGQVKTN